MATSLKSELSIIFKVYTQISAKKSKSQMQRQKPYFWKCVFYLSQEWFEKCYW